MKEYMTHYEHSIHFNFFQDEVLLCLFFNTVLFHQPHRAILLNPVLTLQRQTTDDSFLATDKNPCAAGQGHKCYPVPMLSPWPMAQFKMLSKRCHFQRGQYYDGYNPFKNGLVWKGGKSLEKIIEQYIMIRTLPDFKIFT